MRPVFVLCWFFLVAPHVVAQAPLTANGFARYAELDNDIYIAGLFLATPSNNPADIRRAARVRMEMKIVPKRLTFRRFNRLLIGSSAINNSPQVLRENAAAMEQFLGVFKDNLVQGDHLVIASNPQGFSVVLNGIELASIASPGLFDALLNIWIGDVPPSRDFKTRVLGGENSQEYAQTFNALEYGPLRIQEIASWKMHQDVLDGAEADRVEASGGQDTAPIAAPVIAAPVLKAPDIKDDVAELYEQERRASERSQAPESKAEQNVVSQTVSPQKNTTPTPERKPKATPAAVARVTDKPPKASAKAKPKQNEFSAEKVLAMQLYATELLRHSQRAMEYPRLARRAGHQGKVTASVTIDREGALVDYVISDPAEYGSLNSAVKRGIKKAQPFPKIPEGIPDETFTFSVPVNFKFE